MYLSLTQLIKKKKRKDTHATGLQNWRFKMEVTMFHAELNQIVEQKSGMLILFYNL